MIPLKSNKGTSDQIVKVGDRGSDRYVTHRQPEHFFRIFQGFAISKVILDELQREEIQNILIIYHNKKQEQIVYKSKLFDWLKYGQHFDNKLDSGELDPQLVLNKNKMEEIK